MDLLSRDEIAAAISMNGPNALACEVIWQLCPRITTTGSLQSQTSSIIKTLTLDNIVPKKAKKQQQQRFDWQREAERLGFAVKIEREGNIGGQTWFLTLQGVAGVLLHLKGESTI